MVEEVQQTQQVLSPHLSRQQQHRVRGAGLAEHGLYDITVQIESNDDSSYLEIRAASCQDDPVRPNGLPLRRDEGAVLPLPAAPQLPPHPGDVRLEIVPAQGETLLGAKLHN